MWLCNKVIASFSFSPANGRKHSKKECFLEGESEAATVVPRLAQLKPQNEEGDIRFISSACSACACPHAGTASIPLSKDGYDEDHHAGDHLQKVACYLRRLQTKA